MNKSQFPMLLISLLCFIAAGLMLFRPVETSKNIAEVSQSERDVNKLFTQISTSPTSTSNNGDTSNHHGIFRNTQTVAINYESAPDLHQLYLQAQDSQNAASIYQVFLALRECRSLLANANNFRAAFAGGNSAGLMGKLTLQRQQANDQMLKRCAGFERMDERDLDMVSKALHDKAKRLGSIEAELDSRDASLDLDKTNLLRLLQTRTPSALERAEPAILQAMQKTFAIKPDTQPAHLLKTAVMLANCELGKDCSATSFPALSQCLYFDHCQHGWADDWQEGLHEEEIRQVQAWKLHIVQRVRSGSFGD